MLTQNTLDKIVYEYQHGGVQGNHPELTTYERKALLKHLFSLPTTCPNAVYVGNDEDYTIEPCDCEVIA
jgi:hypothetical protein